MPRDCHGTVMAFMGLPWACDGFMELPCHFRGLSCDAMGLPWFFIAMP